MATTTGEKMYSSLLMQLVRESVPGTHDPASANRFVMTQVKGEFVPEEQWANFRPDGFNEDAWNALSKTHQMFSGTFQPDFSHIEILFEMCCGVKNFAQTSPAAGTVQYEYQPPALGSRELFTYSVERGTPDNCDVSTYGILVSLSMESDRDAASVSGAFTLLARKPAANKIGIAMSGGVAQNHKTRISAANVTGPLGLSIVAPGLAAKAVSIAVGDNAATIAASFLAQGLTVAATGTIAVGAGEVHNVNGTGNALTVYGIDVFSKTVATLQTAIRALDAAHSTAVVTGTITQAVPGTYSLGNDITTPTMSPAEPLWDNNTATIHDFGNGITRTVDIDTTQQNSIFGWRVTYGGQNCSAMSLYGSNSPMGAGDQAAGTLIDAKTALTWTANEVKTFQFAAPVSYRYYRVLLPASATSPSSYIAEVELLAAVGPVGAAPASAALTVTYDSAAGDIADFVFVGAGYTGASTQPGGAGGIVNIEFTNPANAPIIVTKASGDANYLLSTTQQGSNGTFIIPKRIPILPQMMSYRQADTRAGLDAALPFGKVKTMRFAYDSLVSAEWFADENVLTFQSHVDNADAKRTMGVKIAKSSAQLAQMQSDAAASPSIAHWNECRFAHPDGKHLVRAIMLASVMGVAPIKAAGNIQAFDFPLGSVLSDTPLSENSAALIIRKAV